MSERCHCGAERIAELAFCVRCGAHRGAPPALVGAGARGTVPAPRVAAPVRYVAPRHPSLPPMPAPFPTAVAYEPQPAGRSSAPWIVGAAMIVVLAVVGALLVLTLRPATSAASATAPQTVLVPSTTTVTAAPSSSSSSGGSTSSGSGATLLDDQVASDRASVESLVGSWVPQLSSKSVGTVADGISYDAGDILSHYQGLAASYPGAKLLYSGDWPVFRNGGYWVVVVAQPFSTPSAANAWCSAQGFGPDDCFAKKLSHSGGPSGSTVQR